MLKPAGSLCNLRCEYCYYHPFFDVDHDRQNTLSDKLLATFTDQYLADQPAGEVIFAWQGGEPTLCGIPFFKRAIELQRKYSPAGIEILNVIQTNATLLNEDWCRFFRQHNFLVGVSIDGPPQLHDSFRKTPAGSPTYQDVIRGYQLLREHSVHTNILATVNSSNQDFPDKVYRHLTEDLEAKFIQFIPVVEKTHCNNANRTWEISTASVNPGAYGRFLTKVFDLWVKQDIGQVFVQLFDVTLGSWLEQPAGLCVFAPTCGNALVLERDGNLYSCDHFVKDEHLLGNLDSQSLSKAVRSGKQLSFGQAKLDLLPDECIECRFRFACNGGCPKNRFSIDFRSSKPLNYLCPAYRAFFQHTEYSMKAMASLIRQGRSPALLMKTFQD